MEFAQVVGRALAVRRRFAEYEARTTGREWTTTQLMQGFVVDVGDLMRLVMAKEGARRVEDVDARLAHELSDCLWSVLVLADRYGVDLERAFLRTQDEVERWLDGQLAAPPPGAE
jgi:NTP pyrophosphatase (non-canonical NTP hydrolase)